MLNIYLNTWGNYNTNGADGGEWITLPTEEDNLFEKLDEVAERLGDDDPEWFVNDYEWVCEAGFGKVGENEDIETLNGLLNELESLDDWDQEKVAAIIEAMGGSLADALETMDNYTLYHGMDIEEVARELVEECYFTKDTPDIFRNYFDYEAFARDLKCDGYIETSYGVLCE